MKKLLSLLLGASLLLTGVSHGAANAATDAQTGKNATNHSSKKTKRTVKRYPFEFCLVSNDKLGDLGKPIGFAYKGQEIKVCCRDCKKDFDKTPEDYMKRFEKLAAEKAKEGNKSQKK